MAIKSPRLLVYLDDSRTQASSKQDVLKRIIEWCEFFAAAELDKVAANNLSVTAATLRKELTS